MRDYRDKELLHRLYIEEKKSTNEIGRILGCGQMTIVRWLNKYDIHTRTKSEALSGKLNPRYKPFKERFWEKVSVRGEDQCWEWVGTKAGGRYGSMRVDGKMRSAHLISWELHNGQVIGGLCVCHKCDNPSCVNPSHLFLGTHRDNMKDMVKKGRVGCVKGENHGCSKLTIQQVLEIRSKYVTGKYLQRQLAVEYGVDRTTISSVVNRKIWRHI